MHRTQLLTLLEKHIPFNETEAAHLATIIAFVKANEAAFLRALEIGHMTGSAWIVSPARDRVLLIEHKKLGLWLQPGGHADGEADLSSVALREAKEETGLKTLRLVSPEIFDVDVHLIPERKGIPAHNHHDIRFLLEADPAEPVQVTDETTAVRWMVLDGVEKLNPADSVMRMVRRTKMLKP